jgi:DNA polymerase IV
MILHVDMDAFYASVEERERPELKGKPVIVGGTPEGRGVVAAANYVARTFGVRSAMPAARAHRLCSTAVFLRPRIDYYAQVSKQIREIFNRFTPLVEPLSLDEAFLDVTGSTRLMGPPATIGRSIKSMIHDELNLTASVGVAPNKFLAKVASDLEKPNGFVIVDPDRIAEFLDPLPVTRLWGVGKTAAQIMERMRIATIGDLRQTPVERLYSQFGENAEHLWQLANGADNRAVIPDHQAKSISHENTFETDITDLDVLREWLLELTEQVAHRLRRNRLSGRTVQLKLRYADFHTITRSITLSDPTDLTDEIWHAADEMLRNRRPKRELSIRLLGVGVAGLKRTSEVQPLLFESEDQAKRGKLDSVTDQIKARFGSGAVGRAMSMGHKTPRDRS